MVTGVVLAGDRDWNVICFLLLVPSAQIPC